MKKGLSAEIIQGNIGCKVDKPKSMMRECFEEFYGLSSKTEDVDYIEVKEDQKQLPLISTQENFDGICANHVIDPVHVAFLGHDLESK